MKLIVGLGNPDIQYQWTRHNAGFLAIDEYAAHAHFRARRTHSLICAKDTLICAKPMTFMNQSGMAIQELLHFYHCEPLDMLILCDDFSLSSDVIRLRAKGSSGGHKGLQSIINTINTENFPRLRIGVGPVPEGMDPSDFVLKTMNQTDRKSLNHSIKRACECIDYILQYDVEKAMNKYN